MAQRAKTAVATTELYVFCQSVFLQTTSSRSFLGGNNIISTNTTTTTRVCKTTNRTTRIKTVANEHPVNFVDLIRAKTTTTIRTAMTTRKETRTTTTEQ